ncbi:MAG: YebC/PmpR family DNA-binding transcriptional regulator [Oscillospiraceae bacterium]|jgi:YebC/PmpR family DNA-binding regulatory protein|nr:YebC/PmpR family DNA-binding transcriptional regulator [Oscillospiraceae bacterium]
MSGHSKWANIKRQKGKADAARGKIFTKLGREIAIAVREGGGDPSVNGKLRDVVAKAKANNMPSDTITRSIKKAAGELGSVNYEEIIYEGYAPGGVAVIVECVTDNRNRTASDIRHIFDKCGGALGATNCVGYMFDRKGLMVVERKPGVDEDEMMLQAMEAGASDFEADEDVFEISSDVADFSSVREALEKQGVPFLSAELTRVPQNTVTVDDPDTLERVRKLIEMLDDIDDVLNVYHSGDLPDEEDEDD